MKKVTRMTDLVIYGMGGHAKVVADSASRMNQVKLKGFLSDLSSDYTKTIQRLPCLNQDENYKLPLTNSFIVAIGQTDIRVSVVQKMIELEYSPASVVDPNAVVSLSSKLGVGTYIGVSAVVNAGAEIGDHAIINTGAIVEHDCKIGDFSHLSPSVTLGGGVQVGSQTWVGLGASVRDGVTIGNNCIVGMGAVVLNDVPDRLV